MKFYFSNSFKRRCYCALSEESQTSPDCDICCFFLVIFIFGNLLSNLECGSNFALCFFVASVAMVISWSGLALNREPESPTVKTRTPLGHYLRQLPSVLRRDRNYVRFLISRSIANVGGMAGGFFIVYGTSRFGVGGAQVGALTAVLVGSQAVANILWGMVGDRRGHKLVLGGASLCMMLTTAVASLGSSAPWLWATFALMGVSLAADSVSGMNIILEFCSPEERPTYIGLTNTLLAPSKALAPLLGGWLATWAGYRGMFVVALIAAGLGAALLGLWVLEPRRADPEKAHVG